MKYLPINLALKGKRAVVVGGGEIAQRKLELLLEVDATVRLISPRVEPSFRPLLERESVEWMEREYQEGDLEGALIAVAATEDTKVHERIRAEADRSGVLLNVVDRPDLCDFTFPARFRRGHFLVAISTDGASPALSKKIREELEGLFGPEYGELVGLLKKIRDQIPPPERRRYEERFQKFIRSPVLEALRRGDRERVEQLVKDFFGEKFCRGTA